MPDFPTILEEARFLTSNDRDDQYGKAEDSFASISDYWTVYLRHKLARFFRENNLPVEVLEQFSLSGADSGMLLILMKMAREEYKHKRDNMVDLAGYARCVSRCNGDEKIPIGE